MNLDQHMNIKENKAEAFQTGYTHGYEHGVEENPFDHDAIERVLYKQGYDSGVHDYCIEIDEKETE